MNKHYDYLVVGAGLYGAVFAHEAKKAGRSVLVIDKRPNIAGNVYTEEDVYKRHGACCGRNRSGVYVCNRMDGYYREMETTEIIEGKVG